MYFLNLKKLKEEMKQRSLSEREQLNYIIASTIALTIFIIPFYTPNVWDTILVPIVGVIEILGIIYVYKENGGALGKDFLQRLIAIGWVFGLRYLLMVIIPFSILYFLSIDFIYTSIPEQTSLYDVFFTSTLIIIFYLLFGKHMRDVSSGDSNSQ